jgi:TIR domain
MSWLWLRRGTMSAFICYSVGDQAFAATLADNLEELGVPAWYARRHIPKGSPEEVWRPAIFEQIKKSRCIVVVVSFRMAESARCAEELRMGRESGIPVFAVARHPGVGHVLSELRPTCTVDGTASGERRIAVELARAIKVASVPA